MGGVGCGSRCEYKAESGPKQANNSIANMISVPFQYNSNFGVGPEDRTQQVLSIQPVIPFDLNEDWLLVSRWVLPIIDQPDVLENDQTGAPVNDAL